MPPTKAEPLISLVIAAYNHAEFIELAIYSAMAQTYGNFEIIVVDDGSTDGTVQSIKSFGGALQFIQVNRGGPSACLNAGLKASKGTYIAITSGDDISNPERLSLQLEHARRTKSDICFCLPELIDAANNFIPDSEYAAFFGPRTSLPDIDLADLFYNGNYLCASSAFVHASVFEKIGYFDEALVQLSDYAYWMRAAANDMKLSLSPHRVVRYRRHGSNLSSTNNVPAIQAEMPYLLSRVIQYGVASVIRRHFSRFLPPGEKGHTALSNFEFALLFFAHDYPSVRSVGLGFYSLALGSGELEVLPNFEPLSFLINSLKRPVVGAAVPC